MRLAAVLFAGLTGLLTASGQSPLSNLERTRLKRILNPDARRQIAGAIADGILAYKPLVER